MGIEADLFKVTKYPEIMKYRVMSIPSLVINENVVSTGRVPDEAEIATWLAAAETVKAACPAPNRGGTRRASSL